MKKIGLWGLVAFALLVGAAIVVATQMGETSHAYARGSVVLPAALQAQARGVRTLFVIALADDGRPMPLGALRKSLSDDPEGTVYDFVLTQESMMMAGGGGGAFPERFKLKARLDRDGTAGPDQPGDLVGEVSGLRRGQSGVEIRIERVVP